MELSSDLSEKLLNKNYENHYDENKDNKKKDEIKYVGYIDEIHKKEKFDEIHTDNLFLENKKEKKKKKKSNKRVKFLETKSDKDNNSKILKIKVINHFLLAIFTIIQAVLILNPVTTNIRAQERIFYTLFIDNSSKESDDYNKFIYLYNVDELRAQFKKSIKNFYNLDNMLINKINYLRNYTVVELFYFEEKSMNNEFNKFFINNQSSSDSLNKNKTSVFNLNDQQNYKTQQDFILNKVTNYKITQEDIGPFNLDNTYLKIFLNDVKYFRVHFRFLLYSLDEVTGSNRCNEWSIYQKYSFKSRSYFISDLDFDVKSCIVSKSFDRFETINANIPLFTNENIINTPSIILSFINELTWIHIIVIILASFSMFSSWRYIKKFSNKFMDEKYKKRRIKRRGAIKPLIKENNSQDSSHDSEFYNPLFTSGSSSCDEKYKEKKINELNNLQRFSSNSEKKVFNFWHVLCLFSNLIQIIACGYSLVYIHNPPYMVNFLIGLSCMLAIINLARYIKYSTDYAMIYETLNISFPMVSRYITGVLPLFIGFILFGYCLFWESERFSSISSTMRTLFSMINGDSVYATFEDLKRDNFFISQIYLYIFNVSFLIIFLNLFISIIEESYVVAKIRNKTSFIYKYLKIDSKLVNPKIKSKKSLVVTENFFKLKAEEDLLNETKGDSYPNSFYNCSLKPKSYNNLLENEISSFSENKLKVPYNLLNKEKSFSNRDDNNNNQNLIFINNEESENNSKSINNNVNDTNKRKRIRKKKEIESLNKQVIEKLITIESQKIDDSGSKRDSDNVISLFDKDLEEDLLIVDEETYNEKFKSIENAYDKIEFVTEKISGLKKEDKEYIINLTIRNFKIVNEKLQKIKDIWMKNNTNISNTSARDI